MEGSNGSLSLAPVRPPLEFWAPQNRRDIDKVEQIQWRSAEVIWRLEHMMYKERLRDVCFILRREGEHDGGKSYCCL